MLWISVKNFRKDLWNLFCQNHLNRRYSRYSRYSQTAGTARTAGTAGTAGTTGTASTAGTAKQQTENTYQNRLDSLNKRISELEQSKISSQVKEQVPSSCCSTERNNNHRHNSL